MDIQIFFNPAESTELCELMLKHKSDKGTVGSSGKHNFTTFYHALFTPVRTKPLRIFELGIGTNNPYMPSSMGPDGVPGASLRAWRDYFPNSQIYGGDLDRDVLFSEDRIRTYFVDQLQSLSIQQLWAHPDLSGSQFDIIVEDGLHQYRANKLFFENSIQMLAPGGVFIIEDIIAPRKKDYETLLELWSFRYPHIDFRLLEIPHLRNDYDNILLVAQRQS